MFYIFHKFSVFPFCEAMKTFPHGYAPETEKSSLEKEKYLKKATLLGFQLWDFWGELLLPPRSSKFNMATSSRPNAVLAAGVQHLHGSVVLHHGPYSKAQCRGTPSLRHMSWLGFQPVVNTTCLKKKTTKIKWRSVMFLDFNSKVWGVWPLAAWALTKVFFKFCIGWKAG